MNRIDVRPGWRVTDIGCGSIGILDLLSDRIGSDGEVIGLNLGPRSVTMAKQVVAEHGLPNVHIDSLSAYCEPTLHAWDTLFDVFQTFVDSRGADLLGERHLPISEFATGTDQRGRNDGRDTLS